MCMHMRLDGVAVVRIVLQKAHRPKAKLVLKRGASGYVRKKTWNWGEERIKDEALFVLGSVSFRVPRVHLNSSMQSGGTRSRTESAVKSTFNKTSNKLKPPTHKHKDKKEHSKNDHPPRKL